MYVHNSSDRRASYTGGRVPHALGARGLPREASIVKREALEKSKRRKVATSKIESPNREEGERKCGMRISDCGMGIRRRNHGSTGSPQARKPSGPTKPFCRKPKAGTMKQRKVQRRRRLPFENSSPEGSPRSAAESSKQHRDEFGRSFFVNNTLRSPRSLRYELFGRGFREGGTGEKLIG